MVVALLVAALPLVVLGVIAGLRAPIGILLAAYAAIVPFGSAIDLPIPLPPPFDTLSSVMGVIAAVAMVVHLLLVRSGPRELPGVSLVWLLFIGVAGMTYAWSIAPRVTVEELFLLVSGAAVFLLVTFLRVTARERDRIGIAVVAGASVACALGIALFVTGRAPIGKSGAPRFLITGDDPNHTAGGLILPLVVSAAWAADPRRRVSSRAAAGVGGSIIAIGIVLTGSRGGILAALVALIVTAWHSGSLRRVAPALAVVGVAAALSVAVAPAALEDRLLNTDSTGRSEVWRLGFVSCSKYCLQGSGWGTFPDVYQETFRSDPRAGGYRTQRFRAHNIWLQALIETGLAGLALLVAAFGAAVTHLLRRNRIDRGPPMGALLGLAVASSLVSNLTFKYFWLVFIYAAVCAAATEAATPASRSQVPVGTIAGT